MILTQHIYDTLKMVSDAVDGAARGAVYVAVDGAVYDKVSVAVDDAVYGAVRQVIK